MSKPINCPRCGQDLRLPANMDADKLAAYQEALKAARELCNYIRQEVDVTLVDALAVAALEGKLNKAGA